MNDGCEGLRVLFVLVITLAAVCDDLKRYKISNRIVGVGLIAAIVINVLDFFVSGEVTEYVLGGVGAFLIMLVAYSVMAVGAGDVKLSGVLGFFLGFNMMCKVLVLAFLYTGIIGTAWSIAGRSRKIKLAVGKVHTIHYSVALLFGEVCGLITFYTEVWI